MLLFQVYAEIKSKDDEESSGSSVGVKVRAKKKEDIGRPSVLPPTYLLEKAFEDKEVAEFVSSLTPGMQNAIYAASFALGFENSSKCVKSAMKAEEVRSAVAPEVKSQAVAESIKSQATSAPSEKQREVSNFVWSYYNEGLRESQAQVSNSESLSEKIQVEQPEQQAIHVPLSAREAVSLSIAGGSQSPSLIYCAAAMQAVEAEKEQRAAETKRGELLRITHNQHIEDAKVISLPPAEIKVAQAVEMLATERREELVREYGKMERDLVNAAKLLEELPGTSKEKLGAIAALLPDELARTLLSREKGMSRRGALRAQLVKWIAFSRNGKKSLISMPASKLLKLAALSSLLKLGR